MNPHPDSQMAALSKQAMAAFGLHSQPFSEQPAGHDYFTDPVMQMQLNMLQHNIKFSDMLQVLKGDAGCGKTALVIQMLAHAHDEFQIFVARGTESLSAQQILSGMVRIFQQPAPTEIDRCVNLLIEHLRIRLDKSLSSVLIIENAHQVAPDALNQLFEQTDRINDVLDGELRILLVAEPEIESILPMLTSRQLRDGKMFISSVRTLDRKRTTDYVTHRLQVAGLKGDLPFSGRQLTDLYTNSDGIPQKIDIVAAQILNQQAAQQPTRSRLNDIPLRPIATAAVGAIVLSLLMFIFAGDENGGDQTIAIDTDSTEDQTVVELAPTVIPANDESTDTVRTVQNAELNNDQTQQPAEDSNVEATDDSATPDESEAATITLLSETLPNTLFVESHGVNEPTPVTVETPTPAVEKPEQPVERQVKTPSTENTPKPAPLSESEKWLLKQKPDRYVIQLMASYNLEDLKRYARTNNIESKTARFETTRESRPWHVLTYGLYSTAESARAAITKLPTALQRNTPWIRSIKSIQLALEQRT